MSRRILITTFTFPPERNGVAHVAAAHASFFAGRGYEVTVATGEPTAAVQGKCPDGVRIVRFRTSGNGRCLRGGGYHGDVRGYQRFVSEFDGDAIFCHCWQTWSTDLAVPVLGKLRAKKILVSHGVTVTHVEPTLRSLANLVLWRPYVWSMPRMLRAFDHLVTLSDIAPSVWFHDRLMAKHVGVRQSVIPNGVHLERFARELRGTSPLRDKYGIGTASIILYVSNYDDRKNQDAAMRAFVAAGRPESVLVFIGSELNEYAREVQRSYASLAPSGLPRIIFLEKQTAESIAAAYCSADIFICPSKWELQPLVILDAMAAGLPFVSTDVGCVREFPGGIVVRSEAEMTNRIVDLLADASLRLRLGREGRAAAESRYNWDAVSSQYEHLLNRLWR